MLMVDMGYMLRLCWGIENVRIVDSHWTDKAKQCCNDAGVKK